MSNEPKMTQTSAGQSVDVNQEAKDDFAYSPVSKEFRKDWKPLTFSWFGAAMFVGLYYTGCELGVKMGTLSNAFIAIFCGAAFLGILLALNGNIGCKTGCSTTVACLYAYGSKGVFIPAFWVVEFGWYVILTMQFSQIMSDLFPILDAQVLGIILCMLFITNSFVGFGQMANLNRVAMPILLLTGLYGAVRAIMITEGGVGGMFGKEFDYVIPMGTAITTVIGTWSSGATRSADLFRFARTGKDTAIASLLGFGGGLIICLSVGVLWSAGTGHAGVADNARILGGGMVVFASIMFFMQTWTTVEHGAYLQSTSYPIAVEVLSGKNVSRRSVMVVVGLCGMICTSFDAQTVFMPFLNAIGIFVPAVGGVLLADYYIMSKTNFHWTGHKNIYQNYLVTDEEVRHHKFNPSVITGIIVGGAAGVLFNFGVAAINAIVCSALAYCVSGIIFSGFRKKEAAKNFS